MARSDQETTTIEAALDGKGLKIAVIVSRAPRAPLVADFLWLRSKPRKCIENPVYWLAIEPGLW